MYSPFCCAAEAGSMLQKKTGGGTSSLPNPNTAFPSEEEVSAILSLCRESVGPLSCSRAAEAAVADCTIVSPV